MSAMTTFINVPGIGGSGPEHWQSVWEALNPEILRFRPRSWDHPALLDWVESLEAAVVAAPARPVLIAHSLGCLLVAHWQTWSRQPVAGAFLVAPPDPEARSFPADAPTFRRPVPGPLRFPSMVVVATNDPYSSPTFIQDVAAKWRADVVLTGPDGHLNVASDIGAWSEGQELLERFLRTLDERARSVADRRAARASLAGGGGG